MASRKRSAVWLYYQPGEDASKVVCMICLDAIQHCGNTSNMLKHLRSKHHAEYADVEAKKKAEARTPREAAHAVAAASTAAAAYPDMLTIVVDDSEKEQIKSEDDRTGTVIGIHNGPSHSSVSEPKKEGAIWAYYQEGHEGNSALCLLCSENVLYRRNESQLHKHLRKRHPNEYNGLEGGASAVGWEEPAAGSMVHCSLRRPSLQDEACGIGGRFPDILEVITLGQSEQEQTRRALEQEARALQRERELTEQLRRAQEQEARALEQQRELTEQLRRAQEQEMKRAREQEAQALERERQAIEQLRRAQEQEGRAIRTEREALEQLRRDLEQERLALRRRERECEGAGSGRGRATLGTQTDDADPEEALL
ncbi:uncharacterized protein [Paramormyrops kingsleyae]|uniref:Actin cytoskeleton-regulatory complex protein pan1-like n=1 Tax=Paramormyrops kingsleyae TaxID=1676925 RepID=A0A3B3RAF2_9TELE|nr:uncharacterized protein LOC111846119 isoform X1 [Paramormyrops kingsleyae]